MKKIILLLLSIVLQTILIHAQELKGTVTDETGSPLPGANIVGTASKNFAVTDFDGNYSIKLNKGEKIKVTYIGYKEQILAPTFPTMNIQLQPEATSLNEVVVVGYGTRKAVDATMSIAKVKSEELTKTKVLNPTQAIQGKLPGVTIIGSDKPGGGATIVVRGLGTVTSNKEPLYVVDGVRVNLNNINPNDIESYEILKDASALAIYGNEAANGVVLITTKKAKDDLSVDFESFFGYRTPLKMVQMASANQYAYYTNLAENTVRYSQDQPVNTNWLKEVMQPGLYNSNNISFSGKTDKMIVNFSANHYNEQSIIKEEEYKRTIFKLFNEFKPSQRVKLNSLVNVSFTNAKPQSNYVLTEAYRQAPIVPVYYDDGKYGMPFLGSNGIIGQSGDRINNLGNPIKSIDFNTEKTQNLNVIGNILTEIKILDPLKLTAQFGGEINNWKSAKFFDNKASFFADNPSATTYIPTIIDDESINNTLEKKRANAYKWNTSSYLTFNKVIGNHNVELMGGIEFISRENEENLEGTMYNINPIDENYWSYTFSELGSVIRIANKQKTPRNKQSYFARAQYKLFDRYIITANFRRDGSSRFLENARWGNFPSFGAGWIVSNEKFFKTNNTLNFLKIRGGWGLLGNEDIVNNIANFSFSTTGYPFGGAPEPYVTNGKEIDPDLSWEVTRSASAGIEFKMFDNHLSGTFDVYDKLNRNLVMEIKSSATSGQDAVYKHVGKLSNKGFEAELNWNNQINDEFNYSVGVNYSYNNNKLTELFKDINYQTNGGLGNGEYTKVISQNSVGQPIGSFYLYEYAGINENGESLYYRANGDKVTKDSGLLADSDRKFFGSALPTTIYGLNLMIGYNALSLSLQGYATQGAKVYNGKKAQRWGGENIESSIVENIWTPNNTGGTLPYPTNAVPIASTYYLESGDFFRINNINLAYKIKAVKGFIKGGEIYINAINPFITQKYSGFSPEINGNIVGNMGIELDAYPTVKSYVFGVKLNF